MSKIILSTVFSILTSQLFAQFGAPQEITEYFNKDQSPVDFDLDGDIDLIGMDENVFLFRNDGTGNFEKKQLTFTWKTISFPNILEIADINNDGYPDILVSNQLTAIATILKNNGDLTVTEIPQLNGTTDISNIKPIDLDNDGDNDLVGLLSSSYNNLIIQRNLGNFNFSEYSLQFSRPIRGFFDMNNDGAIDIIFGGTGIQIKYNDGNGNFNDSTDISTLYSLISEPKCFDFENDGDIDIAWKSGVNMYFVRNDGNNQFTILGQFNTSVTINNFEVSDLNYDGFQDILISNYSTYYHGYKLNDGNGNFGANVSFNFTNAVPLTTANNDYFAVKDFDGNGFNDILVPGQLLFKATSALNYQQGVKLFEVEGGVNMILLDANNDGWEDLVHVIGSNLVFHIGDSNGQFEQNYTVLGTLTNYAAQISLLHKTDINNDGHMDLLYRIPVQNLNPQLAVFVNQGNGTFVNQNIISLSSFGFIDTKDIDGDNFPDILFETYGSVKWLKNNGNLTFQTAQTVFQDVNSGNYIVKIGKIDNDNFYDLTVLRNNAGTVDLYFVPGNGDGSFTSTPTPILQATNAYGYFLTLGDLNNDGTEDLIYEHSYGVSYGLDDYLHVYHNDGNGNFQFQNEAKVFNMKNVMLTDMNMDGQKDIVSMQDNHSVGICFQLNNQEFTDVVLPTELLDIPIDNYLIKSNKDLIITAGAYDGFYELENQFSNLLSATVYVDENENDTLNNSESRIPSVASHLSPANQYYFSGENGNIVTYDLSNGSNQLVAPEINHFQLSTANSPYSFNNAPNTDSLFYIEFGYIPSDSIEEIQTNAVPGFPRCNTIVNHWLTIENIGATTTSGIITYELDDSLSFVSALPVCDSVIGGTLYWHFDSLQHFEDLSFVVNVQTPDFNSMGMLMTSVLNVTSLNTNTVYTDSVNQTLVCAYDPNDKTVIPQGIGSKGYIPVDTEWLEYLVRFQNTGNDTAININILDYLNPNLDWSSFTLLGSSHSVNVGIDNFGKATFAFQAIHLPDSTTDELGSHGYIAYKIKINENVTNNTQISNTAEIFFDYNPAVITNSTINTLFDCDNLFSTISVPTTSCVNDEMLASVIGAEDTTTCIWYLNGTTLASGQTIAFIADELNLNVLNVEISNNLCSRDSSFNFTVYDYPQIAINPFVADSVCNNVNSVSLPDATPLLGIWSGQSINGNTIEISNLSIGTHHYVYQVSQNGCSSQDSISLTVLDCLGLETTIFSNLIFYPNPFEESITINSDQLIESIFIYDVNGSCVYSTKAKDKQLKINLEELNSGIYMIEVISENGAQPMSKLVKY